MTKFPRLPVRWHTTNPVNVGISQWAGSDQPAKHCPCDCRLSLLVEQRDHPFLLGDHRIDLSGPAVEEVGDATLLVERRHWDTELAVSFCADILDRRFDSAQRHFLPECR